MKNLKDLVGFKRVLGNVLLLISLVPLITACLSSSEGPDVDTTPLMISASVGPLQFLSGASVVVEDGQGRVVGQGTTNTRGIAVVPLEVNDATLFPLRIETHDGWLFDIQAGSASGQNFYGNLLGEVSRLEETGTTLAYLDLITTTASRLQATGSDYDEAFENVRTALGVANRVPASVIRYQNHYIDWSGLAAEIEAYHGYNNLTHELALKIRTGDVLPDFGRQSAGSASDTSATRLATTEAAVSTQGGSDCSSGNNWGSGNSSTEVIIDYGLQSTQILLTLAGQKNVAEATGMVAGMVMTDSSSDGLKQVEKQLACISAQISYLSQQMATLLLAQSVATASACTDRIESSYAMYQGWIESAVDGSTVLNSSNSAFVRDLNSWWDLNECGTSINNSLFSVGGGQLSSWQQLNTNYRNTYQWYSQKQAQELQEFLSWWSMQLHNSFVLVNEYHNYAGINDDDSYFVRAEFIAGSNDFSSNVCKAGSTSETESYCVWANNIRSAYPGDLYSDEAGLPSNGLAIHVVPAATSVPPDSSAWPPLAFNTRYMIQNYAKKGKAYASTFDDIAASYSNQRGINPEALGSAVQTFSNPQAVHVSSTRADVEVLKQPGPAGPWTNNNQSNASEFFYYQVNRSPSSPWIGVKNKTAFYAREDVSKISMMPSTQGMYYANVELKSAVRSESGIMGTICQYNGSCTVYDPIYYLGVLRKRDWWAGSNVAAQYQPPPPPVP